MAYYIKDYQSTLNFVKTEVFFLIYFSYIKDLVNKEMVKKIGIWLNLAPKKKITACKYAQDATIGVSTRSYIHDVQLFKTECFFKINTI
jgi:hypothetical protein